MTDSISIYQGQPLIILSEAGATMKWVGGQPVMDPGLENMALIALFTEEGWPGNDLYDNPDEKIGSRFEKSTRQPITLSALNDIRNAAEQALINPVFGNVTAVVENPISYRLLVTITLEPPGQDIQTLIITKNGLNWTAQAIDPAHRRL